LQVAGCWLQVAGLSATKKRALRLLVAGYRLQVAGYRLQVAGCMLQACPRPRYALGLMVNHRFTFKVSLVSFSKHTEN